MAQINKIEFRNVIIDGTTAAERNLNVLVFSKENYTIYFSLQSVAQFFNELIDLYGAREIFHAEFYEKWADLNLKCMTEFQLTLLVPPNLITEPSTETYNPVPAPLSAIQYLNARYAETIITYADYTSPINDVFAIAERQNFTTLSNQPYYHRFVHSTSFLSFIPLLKLKYLASMYKTFFLVEMVNSNDIQYIYETLLLNRARLRPDDIANVFQLNIDQVFLSPTDLTLPDKRLFVTRFNRGCRVFKSFAFNILDGQAEYMTENLQLTIQFGLDKKTIQEIFAGIPKLRPNPEEKYTPEQMELLCKQPSTEPLANINAVEIQILHSLIRIHLMIQRMTNTTIQKQDLEFYRQVLRTHYSVDLCEFITEETSSCPTNDSYCMDVNIRAMSRNYTIGEIIGEFLKLYLIAQRNINTIWLCQFIQMACNPRYSNLINVMSDYVPFFQRFFTRNFNVNSINNIILFLQGRCKPDDVNVNNLKQLNTFKALNIQTNKTFSLSRYQPFSSNPLLTFMELLLTSKAASKNNYIINLATFSETERHNIVSLIDPDERKFVEYIDELMETSAKQEKNLDLSGDNRFRLQDINYDEIVPIVSTNTFNENNTTTSSINLFNSIINQTTFFHELANRVTYRIPGVVCNVVLK